MIFGRSLFGGVFAGLIMVSGVAACTANATAVPEVCKIVSGLGAAQAAVTGYGHVDRFAGSTLAAAVATGVGHSKVDYLASTLGLATASVADHAQVQFFAVGDARGYFILSATAFKKTRARPLPATLTASAEAEGAVYELAYGQIARCTAKGFGTTYHVGISNGIATADAVGTAAAFIGGRGAAVGVAEATGEVFRAGGAQADGHALAMLFGDAAITHGGVRYFELVGAGRSSATAVLSTTTIHQLQSLLCTAHGTAQMVQTHGVHGLALAVAKLIGEGLNTATGVTGAPGLTTATARGAARYFANGKGRAAAIANGIGIAKHLRKVRSTATAIAAAVQLRSELQLTVRLTAKATGVAIGTRTRLVVGVAQAIATGYGYNQVNDLVPAPAARTYALETSPRLVTITSEARLLAA